MKNIDELRRQLAAKKEQVRSLLAIETRSTEQADELDALLTECENRQKEIDQEVRAQKWAMDNKQQKQQEEVDERAAGFGSFGEFIIAVRSNPFDDRIVQLRQQSMGIGSEGGVLVPTTFRDEILQVSQQGAIIRPRARVIGADAAHPDAAVTIPALNQVGNGMYGGVSVQWIAEGEEKPETSAKFTDVTLTPKEVAGHIVVTDKLLRNASAADSMLRGLLGGAIRAAEDDAYLNGNGVAKPLGIINAPATIAVNRATATQLGYVDLVGMLAKLRMGGSPIWQASQSVLPQLMKIKDDNGNLVWQPNARDGLPGTLLGYPLEWNERSPQLGAKGDLVLNDLSYYLIKDGAPLAISASEHVYFKQNKTVIKAFFSTDGQPWLAGPITQEGGYQVSPFVALDAPAG